MTEAPQLSNQTEQSSLNKPSDVALMSSNANARHLINDHLVFAIGSSSTNSSTNTTNEVTQITGTVELPKGNDSRNAHYARMLIKLKENISRLTAVPSAFDADRTNIILWTQSYHNGLHWLMFLEHACLQADDFSLTLSQLYVSWTLHRERRVYIATTLALHVGIIQAAFDILFPVLGGVDQLELATRVTLADYPFTDMSLIAVYLPNTLKRIATFLTAFPSFWTKLEPALRERWRPIKATEGRAIPGLGSSTFYAVIFTLSVRRMGYKDKNVAASQRIASLFRLDCLQPQPPLQSVEHEISREYLRVFELLRTAAWMVDKDIFMC